MINESTKVHGDTFENVMSELGDASVTGSVHTSTQASAQAPGEASGDAGWAGLLGVAGVLALGGLAHFLSGRRTARHLSASLRGQVLAGARALDPEMRKDLDSGYVELGAE